MPDPNITLTAIQSHAAALAGTIQCHLANAGRCKVWSVGVVAGVLVITAGRAQMAALPCVAGAVVMLAITDACCVAAARVVTDAYNRFMGKLPLNGGNAMKAEQCFVLPAPEPGLRQAGKVFGALGSFSVWRSTARCWRCWPHFTCRLLCRRPLPPRRTCPRHPCQRPLSQNRPRHSSR